MTQRTLRAASRLATVVALLVAVALISAVGGGGAGAGASGTAKSTAARSPTIAITTFSFTPSTLKVKPGTKVKVVNKTSVTHTLTARDHEFNTGDVKGHTSTTFTAPTKPGRYPYFCKIHQYMTGTLVVT